ncbi:hypothetical protein R1sor_026882 [Riccia sorocarpa]|uniref:Uncharacterized protein n=1 Tax=Riccia sorocarpa TaxID=122646 RepID=A0ABD3GES4_9MARC
MSKGVVEIKNALQITRFRFRTASRYLHRKHAKPGVANPYLKLKESTIRGWFMSERRTLKPKFAELAANLERQVQFGPDLVDAQGPQPPRQIRAPRGPGPLGEFGPAVWSCHLELETKLAQNLQQQRESRAILNGNTIKVITKAFFLVHYHDILQERGGPFQISSHLLDQAEHK